MAAVRRFVPQQKPVRARVKERLVALPAALPDGKRNGTFGKPRFDFTDDGAETFICKIRVLAALQNKGTKAEAVPLPAAEKDFLLLQPVALQAFICRADSAVIAVVFTVVRKLYQPSYVNSIAEMLPCGFRGKGKKVSG